MTGGADHVFNQTAYTFSTCVNSSSTGVARPKIETATFTRERPSSTSSTVPLNDANGPSDTRTCSPTSNETEGFGRSMPSLHLVQDAIGRRPRSASASCRCRGSLHFRGVLDQMVASSVSPSSPARSPGRTCAHVDLAPRLTLRPFLSAPVFFEQPTARAAWPAREWIRDLVFEIRIGVDDVPAFCYAPDRQLATLRMKVMTHE